MRQWVGMTGSNALRKYFGHWTKPIMLQKPGHLGQRLTPVSELKPRLGTNAVDFRRTQKVSEKPIVKFFVGLVWVEVNDGAAILSSNCCHRPAGVAQWEMSEVATAATRKPYSADSSHG